ncbi:MAG: hypothetical protein ACRC8D_06020 [Aeromonas sp.]
MSTITVMERDTGKALSGMDSLRQRLSDCLSFQKGSLVGRRNYGANLLDILDRNMTPSFSMDVFVVISDAINEPDNGVTDFRLDTLALTAADENHLEITLTGTWVPTNEIIKLEGLRIGKN